MSDEERTTFEKEVQGRGAAIIAECGKSSAASAANAACDHMRSWWFKNEKAYSMGVIFGDGATLYGADVSNLCFSVGCITNEDGSWAQATFEGEPNAEAIQKNIDALR
jgi:malate dehydrogenase